MNPICFECFDYLTILISSGDTDPIGATLEFDDSSPVGPTSASASGEPRPSEGQQPPELMTQPFPSHYFFNVAPRAQFSIFNLSLSLSPFFPSDNEIGFLRRSLPPPSPIRALFVARLAQLSDPGSGHHHT